MERWRGKVAVVTGASAGIGAACAKALVTAGLTVVGLARRHQHILQLKDDLTTTEERARLHSVACDVSCESDVTSAFQWITQYLGGVDVLVNNAGIIATAELCQLNNTMAIQQTLCTNILGAVYCTREAFHSMKHRNVDGHVFIVNSVAGHQVPNLGPDLPSLNIYPATKFALRAMTEIYRQEFQRHQTGVRITSVSPGIVETDILPVEIKSVVKQFMPMLHCTDVSDAVLWALATPPNVQVHNIILKPMGEKF